MTRSERPPDKYVCGVPHWYVACRKCKEKILSNSPDADLCDACHNPGRPGFGGGNVAKARADQQYHGGYHE
jgi:hypothetical protein